MPPKKIAVLGSTGSIGVQTLDVIAQHATDFEVHSLAASRNAGKLAEQVARFEPTFAALTDTTVPAGDISQQTDLLRGNDALIELATHPDVDMVVVATSGTIAIGATMAAIKANKEIALANKETLVIGGEIVMKAARTHNVELRPIDSEHSALWQSLVGEPYHRIEKLLLTASGGPFRTKTLAEIKAATPRQALKHPNWEMGRKITIDSATMMNKGLEVIEASWLFDQPYDHIQVVVHPQSIMHSMVEFVDGSQKAQLGVPDMRTAIQYALTHPDRLPSNFGKLHWSEISSLTFEMPDPERFPCLGLAYEAGRQGGTYPAVLVAADEIAVELFLQERIGFWDIPTLMRRVLEKHNSMPLTLDNVHAAMEWTIATLQELAHVPQAV